VFATVPARLIVFILLLLVSVAAMADDGNPIMHPDAAQFAAWNAAYG